MLFIDMIILRKKLCCLLILTGVAIPAVGQALTLAEVWDRYAPDATQNPVAERAEVPEQSELVVPQLVGREASRASATSQNPAFPGRLMGVVQGVGESDFNHPWRYRALTYELHYADPVRLASSVYGLALSTKDVGPELPKEKFFGGVLGFHYAVWQICHWLNENVQNGVALSPEEQAFVDLLLQDGVIKHKNHYEGGGGVRHVLAAAPGKKRSFAQNLRHERLHVYWDESNEFQARSRAEWIALTEVEKQASRDKLKNYAKGNEQQLIEEWAIANAETQNIIAERVEP